MSRTFQLTIAYDGTEYAGWQIQPQRLTIQGMLERALVKITKQRVHVTGSGRTDSGVHAFAQVASLTIPNWNATAEALRAAVNTHLPPDIVVNACCDAPETFHAIRDCIGKRYRYQLQIQGTRHALEHRYRWHVKFPVDVDSMREAAKRLIGRQDFACFQATGSDRKTTVRTIQACEVLTEDSDPLHGIRCAIEVEADGFLYNMVRNIVGTLVEVGRGKESVDWVTEVLASRNRDLAGPTAPPHGLFLKRVDYEPFVKLSLGDERYAPLA